MDERPRASSFLPAHIETEYDAPIQPAGWNSQNVKRVQANAFPPARAVTSSTPIADEITRDVPLLVRIVLYSLAAIFAAGGAGYAIHLIVAAFK